MKKLKIFVIVTLTLTSSISTAENKPQDQIKNDSKMGLLDFFNRDTKGKIQKQTSLSTRDSSIENISTQKEGYLQLIHICLGETKKEELIALIANLKNYNGDNDFITTLNFVMSDLDNKGIHFIMALDWKQDIEDLNWRISSSLRDIFNIQIDLPKPEKYGEDKSVYYKNVSKDYDQAIRKKDFQLSFIDTNSDEYVIVVHKTKDEQSVIEAIGKIGYTCLDANSPQINNEN